MSVNLKRKIKASVNVGGIDYITKFTHDVEKGKVYGMCNNIQGYILLANHALDDEPICEDKQAQTYWHEIVHICLDSIGKFDLSQDENFVEALSQRIYSVVSNGEFHNITDVKQLIEKQND